MAAPHVLKLYAVEDCKVAKLTADVSSAPTYDSLIDIPGIKEVRIGGEVKTVELRGDNSLLETDSSLTKITVQVRHAKISLDALAMMTGQTVTDSGATTAEVATLSFGSVIFPYFKLEAKTPTGGGSDVIGDAHLVVWKAKLSSWPEIGMVEEDYVVASMTLTGVRTIANGKWFDIVNNETAAAIA